ncbi:MAG: hypothetical protein QF752_01680, partial [Planctomycetota bacterium]|nr:hypothetical protein [Planctomycetota bacterium]
MNRTSKKLSINKLAPLSIGTPVLILGILLSYVWSTQSRESVVALSSAYIEQLHDLATGKISEILQLPRRISLVNKSLIESGSLDPDDL